MATDFDWPIAEIQVRVAVLNRYMAAPLRKRLIDRYGMPLVILSQTSDSFKKVGELFFGIQVSGSSQYSWTIL